MSRMNAKFIRRRYVNKEDLITTHAFYGYGFKFGYGGEHGAENHRYIDGRVNSNLTIAQLSYIHENGSPAQGIPPRPFISQALDATNALDVIVKAAKRKNATPQSLENKAKQLAVQCRQWIKAGNVRPPLSAERIEQKRKVKRYAKNAEKPLVFTKQLVNAFEGWMYKK